MSSVLRSHASRIWQASLDAVRPDPLIHTAWTNLDPSMKELVAKAPRLIVVGGGKAGAAMSAALEDTLKDLLPRMQGVVNVPDDAVRPSRAIRLHGARPMGMNEPTRAGVEGTREILDLVSHAGSDDVVFCLISGGGSALLPAPVWGVTLEAKQQVTRLLHESGATIQEMNAVRKHLSLIKGGQLAGAFSGKLMISWIISDVIGDPLDVIASGPTAPDPTTFADAWHVLEKYQITKRIAPEILRYLQEGINGARPETPKNLPWTICNQVIGNNALALVAAISSAKELGYRVLNLGSHVEGETQVIAREMAGITRKIRDEGNPLRPPACVLSGGETTVTLTPNHGLGGRNQEFVLAALAHLFSGGLDRVLILSGGTDGEDGPTDAAGAIADESTCQKALALGLDADQFLSRHDAYHFFTATDDLLKTGLTETNVMDVRLMLIQ